MAHEFVSKCQAPKCIDYRWLREHRIVLLLDSLDEVRGNKWAGCVDAIPDFVDRIGTPGVAACSRKQEYKELPDRLKLGGATTLQPLRSVQVRDYLERIGDRLKGLWTSIENDESLIEKWLCTKRLSRMAVLSTGIIARLKKEKIGEKSAQRDAARVTVTH